MGGSSLTLTAARKGSLSHWTGLVSVRLDVLTRIADVEVCNDLSDLWCAHEIRVLVIFNVDHRVRMYE